MTTAPCLGHGAVVFSCLRESKAAVLCRLPDFAAYSYGGFHGTLGGGSRILLLRRGCCLCAWRVSWDLGRRQQNLASEARLLPLCLAGFMGPWAVAAKSCFLRRGCCLCAWWVSWDLWQRQLISNYMRSFVVFGINSSCKSFWS